MKMQTNYELVTIKFRGTERSYMSFKPMQIPYPLHFQVKTVHPDIFYVMVFDAKWPV